MAFNTGNPIGSTDARDLSDNAENFDKSLGTLDATWTDRLGVTRDSFEGRLAKGSFYRVGTFAAGYTLTNMRQTLEYDGHEYSWAGTFPKVVAAGATPETSGGIGAGAWVDRTDVTLRNDLELSTGAEMIGFAQSGTGAIIRTVTEKLSENVSVFDFGAVGDGVTDDTAAIQAAINYAYNNGGGGCFVPYTKDGYLVTSQITVKNGVNLFGSESGANGAYNSAGSVGGGWFTRSYFICDQIQIGETGFYVESNASIEHFGFYYKTTDITITSGNPPEFGWTITASGFGYSLKNLSVMGASHFINLESFERGSVDNISGMVTRIAIRVRRSRDVARINNVHINPNIVFATTGGIAEQISTYFDNWLKLNLTILRIGSSDIFYITNILSYASKYGLAIMPTGVQDYFSDGVTPLGLIHDDYPACFDACNVLFDACKNPIYIERSIGFTSKMANVDLVPIAEDGYGVGIIMQGNASGLLQISNLYSKGTAGKTSRHIMLTSTGVSAVDVKSGRYTNPGNDALQTDFASMFSVTGNNKLTTDIVFSKVNSVGVYKYIKYNSDNIVVPNGLQFGGHSVSENHSTTRLDIHKVSGADEKSRLLSIDAAGSLAGRTLTLADDAVGVFDIRSATNNNGRGIIFVSANINSPAFSILFFDGQAIYNINTGASAVSQTTLADTDLLLNVYVSSTGVIGVKNRLGSSRDISLVVLAVA